MDYHQDDFTNKVESFLANYMASNSTDIHTPVEATRYLAALLHVKDGIPQGIIDEELIPKFKKDAYFSGLTNSDGTIKSKEHLENYFLNNYDTRLMQMLNFVYSSVKKEVLRAENYKKISEDIFVMPAKDPNSPFKQALYENIAELLKTLKLRVMITSPQFI